MNEVAEREDALTSFPLHEMNPTRLQTSTKVVYTVFHTKLDSGAKTQDSMNSLAKICHESDDLAGSTSRDDRKFSQDYLDSLLKLL